MRAMTLVMPSFSSVKPTTTLLLIQRLLHSDAATAYRQNWNNDLLAGSATKSRKKRRKLQKKVVKRAQVTSRGGSLKNRRRLTVRHGMLFNLSVGKYATHFTVVAVEKAIGNEKRE